jgi:hypothetical protein
MGLEGGVEINARLDFLTLPHLVCSANLSSPCEGEANPALFFASPLRGEEMFAKRTR